MKKQKIICLLLTAVIAITVSMQGLVFTAFAENNATSLLLGDANLDDTVNVKDTTSIQKSTAQLITFGELANSAADVDSNKEVNIKDATAIQKWAASYTVEYLIGQLFTYSGIINSDGGFVILSVNPAIRIQFNPDGNVTTITADNTDGEGIIKDYKGYEGKTCKEVVDELLVLIKDAGYLVDDVDGENKTVVIQLESGYDAPNSDFIDQLGNGAKAAVKDLDVKPEIIKIDKKDYDDKYTTSEKPSEFITLEKAVEIALAHSGVWADDAVFKEKEYDIDDGTPYYELEFKANGYEFECEVNATNGKVTEFDKEKVGGANVPNTNVPSTGVPSTDAPSTNAPAPSDEFISLDNAKEIALSHAEVLAENARFEDREFDLDDGTPYYELEFKSDGYEYEYEIHAVSGKIIESEREPVDGNFDDIYDDDKIPVNPDSFISLDSAKEIALNHAGVSAADARFDKTEFDEDDGVPSYELEFEANGFEYEYDINAENGNIIESERDEIDD